MKGLGLLALAAAISTASANVLVPRASSTSSGTLPTVTVKGNAFFAGNNRFYIRGVDWQPGGSSQAEDPIADTASCQRAVTEFKKLGINTVRVYTVDNTKNHDECMTLLASNGIYLVLDVNTPKYSLNRANPGPSYNDVYLQSIFATVDAFAKYSNTLAYFSGNEVINDSPSSAAAPWVKAVTRDLRQYIGSRGYRKIPVGYSAADVSENRLQMAEYMNCGTDDERSDFFAFNDYSYCDPANYEGSGWPEKVTMFSNYSLPLFLSEYGCIKSTRQFTEVSSLYGKDMTPVFSGGLVYEFSEEGSHFGLVTISGDSVNEGQDFAALQSAFQGTPAPTGDGGYKSSGSPSQCPSFSTDFAVQNDTLPAIPEGAKKYMTQGAGTGPGLAGSGSQDAGGASTGTATAGSGKVTATASSSASSGSATKSSAAGVLGVPSLSSAPFVGALVVGLSTVLGACLL